MKLIISQRRKRKERGNDDDTTLPCLVYSRSDVYFYLTIGKNVNYIHTSNAQIRRIKTEMRYTQVITIYQMRIM